MKKTALFIIIPISGIGKHKTIERSIKTDIDSNALEFEFAYTQYPHHATEIARENIGKYDIIVAVGGDGTVNEVASALVHTKGNLSIIPVGSGNGLARAIGISMDWKKALQQAIHGTKRFIDVGYINEKHFFCTSGIGFDALCVYHFA